MRGNLSLRVSVERPHLKKKCSARPNVQLLGARPLGQGSAVQDGSELDPTDRRAQCASGAEVVHL